MEGCDQNGGGIGGSRWNPTKDQINMLEGLYKQGLRTPTAQQIQQITARLGDFGHIEGKNVFYWFQNHKARQRQKQKQKQIKHDGFAYFHRFAGHPANPVFPPFHTVVCSPCYSNGEPAGFCQQYPKVPPPTAGVANGNVLVKRSRVVMPAPAADQRYNVKAMRENSHHQETLDLFPIHPTGVKHGIVQIEHKKPSATSTPSSSDYDNDQTALAHQKPGKDDHFFDFFSCKN